MNPPSSPSSSQLSTLNSQLTPPPTPSINPPIHQSINPSALSPSALRPSPGETLRAFCAFMAYFQLGHARSLPALARHLGERHQTLKNWSCKYHWRQRLSSFLSSLLEQQAQLEAEARRKQAADWARRARPPTFPGAIAPQPPVMTSLP